MNQKVKYQGGMRRLSTPGPRLRAEGHSVRKWRNRLAQWPKIEDTLAVCLGGRSTGSTSMS